ncbi:MAG: choice-of-anchor tandem repeat GloVer-containing protein, partial [Candidatus Sulfotelmatobacter sp.]
MRTVRFSTSFSFAFSICLLATSALAASPQETVLHNFGSSTDGWLPLAPLTMDATGNIYGTTSSAGASGGTVFELTPNGDGTWTETILHQFGFGTDGTKPLAGVVVAADGKIYGTTSAGGTNNDGVIFKLTPESGGVWDEKILLNFDGENGAVPSTLVSNSGYLYGATSSGGKFDYGIVFRMTHEPSGEWTEKILHTFNDNGKDGYNPPGGIVFDSA